MVAVTDRYTQMITSNAKLQQYIHVRIPVIDPTAAGDATVTPITQEVWYSDSAGLSYETEIEESYGTFEPGRWHLADRLLVPASDPPVPTGATLADLPNANGTFTQDAGWRVTFTSPHTFPALTLTFDQVLKDYPTQIRIVGYAGGSIVQDRTFDVNSVVFQAYPPDREGFPDVDRVDILFLQMRFPYRHPRLEHILYGYFLDLTDSDIVSLNLTWDSDPLSRWLPQEKLEFTLVNFDGIYNPDNPNGIWHELQERIPISVAFGQKLSGIFTWDDMYDYDWAWANRQTWQSIYEGGNVFWISLGDFYLNGSPKTRGRTAVFTAVGATGILDDTYYKGHWGPSNLYDLAIEVLEDSDLPKRDDGTDPWEVSEALKAYTTDAPLPIMTHRELLQLIANASKSVIFTDRERKLHIEPMPTADYPDFIVDFHAALDLPDVDKVTALAGVYFNSYTYTDAQEPREIVNSDYDVIAGEPFNIEFNAPVKDISVVFSDGSTYEEYAYCIRVTPATTGTLSVSITATSYEYTFSTLTDPVEGARASSQWATFENLLVTDTAQAREIAEWCKEYLLLRTTYTLDYTGRPELDTLDSIRLQTQFSDSAPVWVLQRDLSYNGAIRGGLICKRKVE